MKWAIGALLILSTAYLWLPLMTPARVFYVTQATMCAALFLLLLLPRPKSIALLASLCLVGATMEALTAICGLAFYWGKGPVPAPAGGAMCDAAHPQTLAWVAVAACLILIGVARCTRFPRR